MDGSGAQALAFVLAGFVCGVFSGALGIGGAAVGTPLVRLLGLSPYLAIGTPVPMILPSTITGAFTYLRAGLVDRTAVLWTAPGAAIAAFGGAMTTRLFGGPELMLASAALLLFLSLKLLPDKKGADLPTKVASPARLAYVGLGLGTGFLSGVLGVGGGTFMLPVFIRGFAMPTKLAVGTSLAVIAVTVPPNIIGHALAHNIDWAAALLLCLGVVPGARIGALLAIKSPERRLRRFMAVTLAIVALTYAGTELVKIFGS